MVPLLSFQKIAPQWLENIREKADEALREREPIRDQQTAGEIRAAPKATAHGGDFWKAREWNALGPAGAEAVSEILNQVETELKWPAQVLLNLIVYLAKAGGARGQSPSAAPYTGSMGESGSQE